MSSQAPAPDSLQGPGFWGGLGNFFSGRPTELRGRPIQQADGSYVVPTYDASQQFKGYTALDPSLDQRWNPARLEQRRQESRQQRAEDRLIARADRQDARADSRFESEMGLRLRQLEQASTAAQNQLSVALAGLNEQSAARKDTNQLAVDQLRAQTGVQVAGLNLQGQKLAFDAQLATQQLEDNRAWRSQQLQEMRADRKLAFISNAARALLA